MQTLAVQITAVFLIILVVCFVWVLAHTGPGNPKEAMPTAPYRLRNRLFALVVLAGVVISLTTLLPWPHDVGATAVTRSIEVKAKQWAWELSDDKAKVGDVIEFRVSSEDVSHGFGLYDEQHQLLAQIQAMPGFVNKVRHRFTAPGTYQILCMEYCGLAHHGMVATFVVRAAP